jgi:hypothetical protein
MDWGSLGSKRMIEGQKGGKRCQGHVNPIIHELHSPILFVNLAYYRGKFLTEIAYILHAEIVAERNDHFTSAPGPCSWR